MIRKEQLTDLSNVFDKRIDLFICSVSFESRCVSVAERIFQEVSHSIVIQNQEGAEASEANLRRLESIFDKKLTKVKVFRESPIATANAFIEGVISAIKSAAKDNIINVLIDITTFTHEQLLILIALIRAKTPPAKIEMAYTGAGEYSINTDDENIWLSRGVYQIRSVLGYPGKFAPSKRLHLMILVGHENERAQTLIEMMEPARVSLGVGHPDHSVSSKHYSRNKFFYDRLNEFVKHHERMDGEVEAFNFSCVNPFDARDAILSQVNKYSEFNTVLSPMNTKISTVGAALAALECERIQLAYASPAEYNRLGYSTPGDAVTLFDLP